VLFSALHCGSVTPTAGFDLGPEELVQADGFDIEVPGYSVPSFIFWDGDDLRDLVVGEGGGGIPEGKVRIYLNIGTEDDPLFADYFYAQSADSDLVLPAGGCLGVFPRVVYWDSCGRRDLLVGLADGEIWFFENVGSQNEPYFEEGTPVEVGETGFKEVIDVGSRPTSSVVDWNNDGMKDLVAGALDGLVRIYINEGTNHFPDFITVEFAQADSGDLEGAARSRVFVCDWTGDGLADVLVGSNDGLIRLYQGIGVGPIISRDEVPPSAVDVHFGSLDS